MARTTLAERVEQDSSMLYAFAVFPLQLRKEKLQHYLEVSNERATKEV